MGMTLGEFLELCKRQMRHGDPAVTSDQVTEDLVRYLNLRRRRFWRKWYWDWSLDELSTAMVVGQSDYTFGATVGEIIILQIEGEDDYLTPVGMKEYFRWKKKANEGQGTPTHYIRLGRDASKNIKVRVWRTPSAAGTIGGFAKKRLTDYTVADIATNTGFEYFPDDVLDILKVGVESDIAEAKGNKEEALEKDRRFEKMMKDLIPEEMVKPDEQITTPAPEFWRRRRGLRRSGTTVV